MIDFRYHLVSIVAVFLALAIGIVVGATALKPKTLQVLDKASRREEQQISAQRAMIRSLNGQINIDQAFAQAGEPLLLGGGSLLQGQRVVLVTAPGADGSAVSGITAALQEAGAKVTGQAQLQPAFFDTSARTQNSLDVLAQQVAPPSVIPSAQQAQPEANAAIAGQQEAAQALAPALVTKDGADLPATQTGTILSGFAHQGFLQFSPASGSSATPAQATLAVVVTPASPPSASDSSPANLALISLAEQLKLSSRGVVLAGSLAGSGPGSVIDELVNGSTGFLLSSVDDADTEVGQVLVVQALGSLLARQNPQAYGVGTGKVPTPSQTASPAATATLKPKSGG